MPHNLTSITRVHVKQRGLGMSNNGDRLCLRCGKVLLYLIDSNTHMCIPCSAEYSFPEFRGNQAPLPSMRPYERYEDHQRNKVGFRVNHAVEQHRLPLNTPTKIKRLIYKKRG